MRSIRFGCVAVILTVVLALAHGAPDAKASTPTAAPVALVYVASSPSDNPNASNVINTFAADSSGRLTRVGSPLTANVGDMVVNGKYLIGLNRAIPYIPRFLMEPNGTLHWLQSTKVRTGCGGGIGPLILDHTGS